MSSLGTPTTALSKADRFLGRAWRVPLLPDAESKRLGMVSGRDAVRQSIGIILNTEPGERVMRRDFGCGLRRFLMRPNTSSTRALIRQAIDLAITRWEPRVRLDEVSVEAGDDPSHVVIRIEYTVVADRSEESLVFPFYLE